MTHKHKNVRRDITIGESAEQQVIKLLSTMDGVSAEKHADTKTRSHYDLVCACDDKPFTVEVKHDIYASKSGNVAIEFYNPKSGKDSGIGITKADLWCHIIDGEHHFTTVERLKKYMSETTGRCITAGGDGNASLWLYKVNHIIPAIFVLLDSKQTLQELLDELQS